MDQALSAHVKILDYSCTQYREAQKMKWLDKCIEVLALKDFFLFCTDTSAE
jgi:ubiquitin carboxyl-terminal hydrolase 9/24